MWFKVYIVNDTGADGSQALTITGAGSSVQFDGIVGGRAQRLKSLTVANGTLINTTAISTTGAQDYNGPVTLGKSVVLNSGSSVTFGNTVDQNPAGPPYLDLTINVASGATVINGALNVTALSLNGGQAIFNGVPWSVGGIRPDRRLDGEWWWHG